MSLRASDLIVHPTGPFDEDLLDRGKQVKGVCDLLVNDPGPVVIALDGKFGAGKTTFLRMAAAHLRSKDVVVLEFNTWHQSRTGNPLFDLTSALPQGVTAATRILEIAKKVAFGAAAVATNGIVNADTFGSGDDSPANRWNQIEEQRSKFRTELENVTKANDGKLVVLLDELDRCIPQQALEYLNVVRNLFDVPGVAVLIGTNTTELEARVKYLYGDRCDAERYLRRFWDLLVYLQAPRGQHLDQFLATAVEAAEMPVRFAPNQRYREPVALKILVERTGMSLRDIQQTTQYLARVVNTDVGRSRETASRLVAAFFLRVCDRKAFDDLVTGKCDAFDAVPRLLQKLQTPEHYNDVDEYEDQSVRKWLRIHLLSFEIGNPSDQKRTKERFIERFVQTGLGDKSDAEDMYEAENNWMSHSGYLLVNIRHTLELLDQKLCLLG